MDFQAIIESLKEEFKPSNLLSNREPSNLLIVCGLLGYAAISGLDFFIRILRLIGWNSYGFLSGIGSFNSFLFWLGMLCLIAITGGYVMKFLAKSDIMDLAAGGCIGMVTLITLICRFMSYNGFYKFLGYCNLLFLLGFFGVLALLCFQRDQQTPAFIAAAAGIWLTICDYVLGRIFYGRAAQIIWAFVAIINACCWLAALIAYRRSTEETPAA